MPAPPTEYKPYERWCHVNFLLSIVFPGAQIHSCLNRVDIQSIVILCWIPSSIQHLIFDQLPGTEWRTKDKNLPCLKEFKCSEEKKIKPLSDFSITWYVPWKVIHSTAASASAWVGVESEKKQVKAVEKGLQEDVPTLLSSKGQWGGSCPVSDE